MYRLYRKNGMLFSILWIVVYVVGLSAADALSLSLGVQKSVTAAAGLLLSAVLYGFLRRHGLTKAYGLCCPSVPARWLQYYLPLAAMVSVNLWYGITLSMRVDECLLYVVSMLLVGFLEEMIFRGLLFCEMKKQGLVSAIVVSSLTFGIGHLVNLFNGSGADLLANVLQVVYAAAAGLLFCVILLKTGSLLSCILTHSILNALGIFAEGAQISAVQKITSAIFLTVVSLGYTGYILYVCKKKPQTIQ